MGAKNFLDGVGEVGRPHGLPALLDFAIREAEKDASIMKQTRKTREERNLAQKNKKEDT